MEALIVLATVMALFGVLGYLRGTKSTLFTTVLIWLGLVVVGRAGGMVARTINGLNYAVHFALAGGLGALGGGGDRGAALEAVFAKLGDVKPLINSDGTGPGMLLIFLMLVLVGFLLGMLKLFKSRPSLLGLALGLANGYVLSAFLIQSMLSESGFGLPLPTWLFGGTAQPAAAPAPTGPSLGSTLAAKIVATLNSLVDSGQIALVIAIAIVIFVLLATRLGNRSAKKG